MRIDVELEVFQMERKSGLSRVEATDDVDVVRYYTFAVIKDPGDYGCYYSGQLVPLEWEGENNPREVGIGRAKPGKLNATYEMFDDFFKAVDFAREIQVIQDDYEDFKNVSLGTRVSASEGSNGCINLRWGTHHTDIITMGQGYDAIAALVCVLPPLVDYIKLPSVTIPISSILVGPVSVPVNFIEDPACGLCDVATGVYAVGSHKLFPDMEICMRCVQNLAYIENCSSERVNLMRYKVFRNKGGKHSPSGWLAKVRDGEEHTTLEKIPY